MEKTRPELIELLLATIKAPVQTAPRIASYPLPPGALRLALVAVSALSSIVLFLPLVVFGGGVEGSPYAALGFFGMPFGFAALQLGVMLLIAGAIYKVGSMFGGTGGPEGALRIVVWLQFVMLLLSLAQLVAMIMFAPLAGLVVLGSFALIFWMLTGLIAGLHGFRSQGLVLLGILGTFLGFTMVVSLLVAIVIGPSQ